MSTKAAMAVLTLGILVGCSGRHPDAHVAAARTRLVFAQAMAKVQEGMSAQEVAGILGKSDDVRTEYDPGGIYLYGVKEVWGYGTDGHLTFATLGSVCIDNEGKVKYVFGGGGKPPAATLFAEDELRRLLRVIDRTPGIFAGFSYNPLRVVQTVNALQPLGKEKVLAAIDEYLRVGDTYSMGAREGLFLVLPVLFDVPADPGYMPEMLVGSPFPGRPEDPKLIPRFPVILQDDVPFYVNYGYALAGCPQPVEQHVDYFREHGTLREKPLSPGDKPLEVFHNLCKSPEYRLLKTQEERGRYDFDGMALDQLLRMVDSVYRPAEDMRLSPCGGWFCDAGWEKEAVVRQMKKLEDDFAGLAVRWDGSKNAYTFRDGTTLASVPVVLYRRCIWKPKEKGFRANIAFERMDPTSVCVEFVAGAVPGKGSPGLRVFATKDKRLLVRFEPEPTMSDAASLSTGNDVKLADGEELQAELWVEGLRLSSPVFKP